MSVLRFSLLSQRGEKFKMSLKLPNSKYSKNRKYAYEIAFQESFKASKQLSFSSYGRKLISRTNIIQGKTEKRHPR